jgi:CMP-N-acetylneuraminic acid synthetase
LRRIAIIPARGGSKRLPRKNIIPFQGRPIIAHTIEAAKSTGLFERVVVSTEDKEIAEVSTRFGAEIDRRDPALATDTASVKEVCLDFLRREEQAGRSWDLLCVLYATAPLRNGEDIRQVVELINPGSCDFSIAVTRYEMPPHQALRLLPEQRLEPMWPELVQARSDEVGELRVDNGSTYAVSVPAFQEHQSFYGPNLCGYEMPQDRSVDIDTREDLDLVSFYAERRKS